VAAGVEFLPGGAVQLHPDQITFGRDYRVDSSRFRLIAQRGERDTIDISREALEDAAAKPDRRLARRATYPLRLSARNS
jgi:hypothetical protein